ncbi:Retrovirus-related Pol polyprotein from transposon RE1; Endonuclease RE1 [Eumeta japonica]|uniref:Retrovirus-related Pol polyprotein from transposon RE1 Endonuclease RE1 n=1 Tax=Eumeta variegata TaxID=151549 RepID=A0A4C1UUT8_EUMVA|nr:Retrovirus-related Pol polyprotein from transposon RE1; Endonuclease RE1 [Eumeta japonica]
MHIPKEKSLKWDEKARELILVGYAENVKGYKVYDPENNSVTVVQCKWVFKKKYNSVGEVRYRARLVAKGFTQKAGIDYHETFSPVLRYTTLRLLFSLSVKLNLDIRHLDVTTAFLNGYLNECVYMEKPINYRDSNDMNKVLKLKRAIYGLKQ